MKFSYTIEIECNPETVFYWLGDPERAKTWMSSVSETEVLHQTENMVGTTFREIVEENGQRTELRGVVTDYRPNQSIGFHLNGEYHSLDVEYNLEEVGGRTRLTQHATIRFRSFMRVMIVFAGSTFKKKITKQLQAEFAQLRELCERGSWGSE